MHRLTRSEVRAIDQRAIEAFGVAGVVLMENAGAGAARLLAAQGPRGRVAIACGRGNNGGDGFVIARHLELLGFRVQILLASPPADYHGDAAANLAIAERSGIPVTCLDDGDATAWRAALAGADWIVDALLGTGANGPPRGVTATAISAMNDTRQAGTAGGRPRVLAVDLPSGLDADSGDTPGVCVEADLTATFVAEKVGFANPHAATFTGAIHVVGIGAPACLLQEYGISDRGDP